MDLRRIWNFIFASFRPYTSEKSNRFRPKEQPWKISLHLPRPYRYSQEKRNVLTAHLYFDQVDRPPLHPLRGSFLHWGTQRLMICIFYRGYVSSASPFVPGSEPEHQGPIVLISTWMIVQPLRPLRVQLPSHCMTLTAICTSFGFAKSRSSAEPQGGWPLAILRRTRILETRNLCRRQ